MQIARTASILFLIALSGCTDKLESSDSPAIGLTAEPAIEIDADEAPIIEQASDVEDPAQPAGEPRMQSPVRYD